MLVRQVGQARAEAESQQRKQATLPIAVAVGVGYYHLQRLNVSGVQFKSLTEQYLDSTGVFRKAIIAILAAIAKQKQIRFFERIKAGQARSSKKPGRPALAVARLVEVRRLRAQGLSFQKTQFATRVPVATMHKCLVARI